MNVHSSKKLKITHLWVSDAPSVGGGGAGSMYRLHTNLRKAGVDSVILCRIKTTASSHVYVIPRRMRRTEALLRRVTKKLGLNDIHFLSSFLIKNHGAYKSADIVNFHGTHGFINYLALPKLTNGKKAVLTLRDMWCMTGHCAVSYDCDRWRFGCGHCPYPQAYPPISTDNTRIEWKLKEWVYGHSNLTIVSVSKCQTEQAQKSLLSRFPINHIPNGVDTEDYQPLDPVQCRALLGIPKNFKVLMFAATDLNNYGKGGDLLLEALRNLPASLKRETFLLLLGSGGKTLVKKVAMKSLSLGYVTNERLKAIAYSAADVFVLPSRSEGLSLVLLESMSCGTPMVSFKVGGNPDLVRNNITGYLAKPGDASDLQKGIISLFEDDRLRSSMAKNCRKIALNEYASHIETQRYVNLYEGLMAS